MNIPGLKVDVDPTGDTAHRVHVTMHDPNYLLDHSDPEYRDIKKVIFVNYNIEAILS